MTMSPLCVRLIGATVASLALSGAALADTAAAAPADVSSQIVVRDATTGNLRAATAQEANQLRTSAPVRAGARLNTEQRFHFSGARGVRLSNEFLSHATVTVLADGSLVEQCNHTPEEAAIAHKAIQTVKANATLPTE
jgi:hypothetical protein